MIGDIAVPQHIVLPETCLVLLVGVSGSGKSTFAKRHFSATEILSSDAIREEVLDDINDQSGNQLVFDVLHARVEQRMKQGLLTVVDATNVAHRDRIGMLHMAKQHYVQSYAIVFDFPLDDCLQANAQRQRQVPTEIISTQYETLRKQPAVTGKRSFRKVHSLPDRAAVDALTVSRRKMPSDYRSHHGPYDIVGDVHGCFVELCELIEALGYQLSKTATEYDTDVGYSVNHPEGRKLIFVGDLVDRGPASVLSLKLARDLCVQHQAFCIPGNHEARLLTWLEGGKVKPNYGLQTTMDEFEQVSESLKTQLTTFLQKLPTYLQLDDGKLLIAHAGLKESMHGRHGGKVISFCLYGDTGKGAKDEQGLPIRGDWAQVYSGKALVVHGHVPMLEARHLNNTWCVDTGCVFGGTLSALRYPEQTVVSVPAKQEYWAARTPMTTGYPDQPS